MDRAKLLASTDDDGALDLEEVDEVMEELEELFYYGNMWLPWTTSREARQDFRELSRTLALSIIQLKKRVFLHEDSTKLCELARGGPNICQYCNWAICRIGRGYHGAPSDLMTSPSQESGCLKYTHLCAVDHSQNLPLLEQRAQEGCALCGFLREHFAASLQEASTDGQVENPFYVWLNLDWDDALTQTDL